MKILVLGIGNDILGDDAVGLAAAETLRERLDGRVDVIMTQEAGLSLLDFITGYDRVLVLDAVESGRDAGTIVHFDLDETYDGPAPCRHRIGLAEVVLLGERQGPDMPVEVKAIAMEVTDPYTLKEGLSPVVEGALPRMIESAIRTLDGWLSPKRTARKCTNCPSQEKSSRS